MKRGDMATWTQPHDGYAQDYQSTVRIIRFEWGGRRVMVSARFANKEGGRVLIVRRDELREVEGERERVVQDHRQVDL